MARTLHPILGCKHECKWATQAIEVEEGREKRKKKKKKEKPHTHTQNTRAHAHTRAERDPQEYRAAGFLTIPSHISSTYLC